MDEYLDLFFGVFSFEPASIVLKEVHGYARCFPERVHEMGEEVMSAHMGTNSFVVPSLCRLPLIAIRNTDGWWCRYKDHVRWFPPDLRPYAGFTSQESMLQFHPRAEQLKHGHYLSPLEDKWRVRRAPLEEVLPTEKIRPQTQAQEEGWYEPAEELKKQAANHPLAAPQPIAETPGEKDV